MVVPRQNEAGPADATRRHRHVVWYGVAVVTVVLLVACIQVLR